LGFEVSPAADAWRWRFVLANRGTTPMPVVADRRLVWLEVAPPPVVPGARRVRRRARVVRCVHDARPSTNERSPEVVLGPGERYAEAFDLRDQCNLRMPAGLVAGARVVFHYGFVQPRRGRVRLSRSVVRDERPEAINDLTAAVEMPALPTDLVPTNGRSTPTPERDPGTPTLDLSLRVSRAATGAGLGVTVTVRNPSVHPVSTLWRPSMFAFELDAPDGRRVLCESLMREPSAQLEYFARFAGRGRRSISLRLAEYCPLGAFDHPGVYLVRARFVSHASGAEYGLGRVFVGESNSPQAVTRVGRGHGAYTPFDPERLR